MELTLQPEDVALLKRILSLYLSDLRMEISNTENYDMRKGLQEDERRAVAIVERLEAMG